MAITVNIKAYEPDGTSERSDWTGIANAHLMTDIGTRGDPEFTVRDLRFAVSSKGGLMDFSFTVYADEDNVTLVEGDIIKVDDGTHVRYVGKVDSISPDHSQPDEEYEERLYVRGRSLIQFADSINYSLRESDGGAVSTNIQDIYTDLFEGGKFVSKGQDNNIDIETAVPLITYAEGSNTLETLSVNVSYKDTPATTVQEDTLNINNGTLDLESVEPYIMWIDVNGNITTEQRATNASPLQTFDIGDGNFPLMESADLATADGWVTDTETSEIRNKFTLNGTELTSSQYGSNVTTSRSTFGERHANPLDNKNITIEEGQQWLDGFILDMLAKKESHRLHLKKSTYGLSPVWFSGNTDTPSGYIKLTENSGGTTLFNVPFRGAEYRLDSAGWDITITCGGKRPNIEVRSRILTEFTGLGVWDIGGMTLLDPSNTADTDSLQGKEFFQDIEFQYAHTNPDYPVTAADVTFIVTNAGGDFWSGGATVKTITSISEPNVRQVGTTNLFKCSTYNLSTPASKIVNGVNTIYSIALTNNTQYYVYAQVTISVDGVDQVKETARKAFYLSDQTTANKADDSKTRMPDAEKQNVRDYVVSTVDNKAEIKFFPADESPPDAGAKGWFITTDSIAGSWTRISDALVGDSAGTTSGSYTVDNDDSEASYVYLNFGTTGAALRFDISGAVVQVNHGAGWVSLATGASTSISDTYASDLYELKVNSSDGSLTFTKDPSGTPVTLLKASALGEITTYDAIVPDVDEQDDLGSATKKFDNLYLTTNLYTQDIIGTGDGGSTTDYSIVWDGTNGVAFPTNLAIGFWD